MAIHDRAVSDRDVLCGSGAAASVRIFAALHAETVITLIKATVLDESALYGLEIDAVGVGSCAVHVQSADYNIIRAQHVDRPVRGIANAKPLQPYFTAIAELKETWTRHTLLERLSMPVSDLSLEGASSGNRNIRRPSCGHKRLFPGVERRVVGEHQMCAVIKVQLHAASDRKRTNRPLPGRDIDPSAARTRRRIEASLKIKPFSRHCK